MKKIFVVIFLLGILQGCILYTDYLYGLRMNNNSSNKVVAGFTFDTNEIYCYGSLYPDTLLPDNKTSIFLEPIEIDEERSIYSSECSYDRWFDSNSDKISIFVFDQDTLNKYSWTEVKESYNILIRYDLTYDDIEKLDYTIPYPPTEEMKEMQIYRPHSELD